MEESIDTLAYAIAAWAQLSVRESLQSHVLLDKLAAEVSPVGQCQVFPLLFKAAEGLVSGI